MTYTILEARYANAEHTSARILTVEDAGVMVSVIDTPELWEEMLASGVAIAAYEPPPPPKKPAIQSLADLMVSKGLLAQAQVDEALAR